MRKQQVRFLVQAACTAVEGGAGDSTLLLAVGSNSTRVLAARLDGGGSGGDLSEWMELREGLSASREGPALVLLDGMATVFGGRGITEVEQVRPGEDRVVTLTRPVATARRYPAAVAVPKSFCSRNWEE